MFGTINHFNARGFGFIRVAANAEDIYFHISEFDGEEVDLTKGTKVEFEFGIFKGKPCGRSIRLLEKEPAITNGGAR
jgi:cold shock CspA family protein